MAQRIVVIGGGAAGIGAAGAAKGVDPAADVRVYTEFEDVGYSPCGIPYVHGKEIPDFERLFLATKEAYADQGIDIHYEARVTSFSTERKTVSVDGQAEIGYDKLIVAPVQESWQEKGAKLHFNTTLTGFAGDTSVRAVTTSAGEIACDLAVVCTKKEANTSLAGAAGLRIGSANGIIVDERMQTSAPDVWAAGDCIEVPHSVTDIPIQGLSGSHAYSQGKVAGTNAAGGDRRYQPVSVPWGMVAGDWMIGGVSFSETLATALGIPHVVGVAEGISRARYYPGVEKVRVKLLAEPGTLRLIGAQMVGREGIKERADFLAMAVRIGITIGEFATMENVYSPPIGALNEPIALAAQNLLAGLRS